MGMTEVRLIVKNPRSPSKTFQGKFLVDSGATYTVVPEADLKKLSIKSSAQEEFSLADGRTVTREVGSALYEYEGIERIVCSWAPLLLPWKRSV